MTLDKTVDGFKTSSKTEESVVLKSFGITGSEFNDTSLEVNQGYFGIPIETEFEGSGFYDISMVPLVYTVSYNGKTYGPRNLTLTDDGNYEGDFKELNMCFAPITDNQFKATFNISACSRCSNLYIIHALCNIIHVSNR